MWGINRKKERMNLIEQIYILVHHDKYPTIELFSNQIYIGLANYSIVVKKSSHQYMSRPFGQCFNYVIPDELTYYSMSYIECYRKCLTHHYNENFNCVPYIIDKFITGYDLIANETKICSTNTENVLNRRPIEKIFVKKCLKKCPKECFRVDYSSEVKERLSYFSNQVWLNIDRSYRPLQRLIVWDSSEPMFAYIDEPVMTFTQYLVYCGGLMGLWFGQSVKDLFSLLIDKSFWRSIIYEIVAIFEIVKQLLVILCLMTCKILNSTIKHSFIFFVNIINYCLAILLMLKNRLF